MDFNIYDYKNFTFNLNPIEEFNYKELGTENELIRKLIDVFYLILDNNNPNFFNIQFNTVINEELGHKYLLPNISLITSQYKPLNLNENENLSHLSNETKSELTASLSPIFIQCSLLINLANQIESNPHIFGLSYLNFKYFLDEVLLEFYNEIVRLETNMLDFNNQELKLISLNQFLINIKLKFDKLDFLFELISKLGYYDEAYDDCDECILCSLNTTLLLNHITLSCETYLISGQPEHHMLFEILQRIANHYFEKLNNLLINGELIDPYNEIYLSLQNNFNEPVIVKQSEEFEVDVVPLLFGSFNEELIKVAGFKLLLNNLKDENFELNNQINGINSPINLINNDDNTPNNNIAPNNLMDRLSLSHKPKIKSLVVNQPKCPIILTESLNQLEKSFINYLNELIIPITQQLKPIILNQLPQLKHLIDVYLLNPPFPDELLNHLNQYPPLPAPTLYQLYSYFNTNYYNIKVQLNAPSIPIAIFDEVPTSPIVMFLSTLEISVELPFPINIIFDMKNLGQLKTLIYLLTYCQLVLKMKVLKSLPKQMQLFKYRALLIVNQLLNYLQSTLISTKLTTFYKLVDGKNLLELNLNWEEIKQNFLNLSFLTKKLKPIFNSVLKLILISLQLNHFIIKFNYSSDEEFDKEDSLKLDEYFNLIDFELKFLSRTLIQLGDNIQFKLVKELALSLDFGEYLES